MTFAVLAAHEQPPRDWTLPPQEDIRWLGAGQRPLGFLFPTVPDATEWLLDRLAEGDRVIAADLDALLGWWLYRQPTAPSLPALTDALLDGRLVSLEDTETTIAAIDRRDEPPPETTLSTLVHRAKHVLRWLEDKSTSVFWSRDADGLEQWLAHAVPAPDAPVQPHTAGILGTAPSVLNRSVGLVMSWHGLAVDDDRIEDLLKHSDNAACDRITDLSTSVREDNRCHPWHYLQTYKRLGSRWPNYQALSWRRNPDERTIITTARNSNLQGIDVTQAELHSTAACWRQLFGDTRLTDLLAGGTDIHSGTAQRLVDERLVPRTTLGQHLRQLGKAINLALINLASAGEIVSLITDFTEQPPRAQEVSRMLSALANEYPIKQWGILCTRVALNSSPDASALVPTLTGRWLRIPAAVNKTKPPVVAIAAAMTQSIFADMHAMGMVELIRAMGRSLTANGRLVASVFDELLVEMPRVGVLDQRPYVAGTQRITCTQGLRADVRQFGSHWSG